MNATDSEWPIKPEKVAVPARPSGLWTLAYEYVRGPALIRFETQPEKQWKYALKATCTADGDLTSMILSQGCVFLGAPVGALIGKVGGSTAGQTDGKVFLVGSFAIIEIESNIRGPIYLTINDEVSGMDNNSGSLDVNIQIKPVAAPSQSPPQPPVPQAPAKP